jgi:hydrogenase maturation protease
VGLRVANQLEPILANEPGIEVGLDYWGGLRLMERMVGFDRAIVIDAIRTGAPPGTIHLLSPTDTPTQRSASAHDVNLATALEFGRHAGARLPDAERITLIGIEANDVFTFDETLTAEVEAAIPLAINAVLQTLQPETIGETYS